MGNREHMAIAKASVPEWNRWRSENLRVQPDLTRIDLSGRDLSGIDFRGVGLFKANLSGANLRGAILRQSILIKTDFRAADLSGAHVYGASVWDVKLDGAIQKDLVVTEPGQMNVTSDNLEMAQFLYLLMNNKKLRDVIDEITSRMVLILGRFTPARKAVLNGVKEICRKNNLLPVLFDFEGPRSRNLTETVQTLAYLSRFIIADVTAPKSIPQELQATVPALKIPVVPIVLKGEKPHALFSDLAEYHWVLQVRPYKSLRQLETELFPRILAEVENKLAEIRHTRQTLTH
jgi:Pentapeptide repeats (8 copies)